MRGASARTSTSTPGVLFAPRTLAARKGPVVPQTAKMTVTLPDGRILNGTLDLPDPPPLARVDAGPMHVGVNRWFPKFTTAPAYTRVFFAPGEGLARIDGARVGGIPPATLPWISHKDEVPLAQVGCHSFMALAGFQAAGSNHPMSRFRS